MEWVLLSGLHLQSGLPGRPLWRRALTILPVPIGFLAIDRTPAALTLPSLLVLIAASDPDGDELGSRARRGGSGRAMMLSRDPLASGGGER